MVERKLLMSDVSELSLSDSCSDSARGGPWGVMKWVGVGVSSAAMRCRE